MLKKRPRPSTAAAGAARRRRRRRTASQLQATAVAVLCLLCAPPNSHKRSHIISQAEAASLNVALPNGKLVGERNDDLKLIPEDGVIPPTELNVTSPPSLVIEYTSSDSSSVSPAPSPLLDYKVGEEGPTLPPTGNLIKEAFPVDFQLPLQVASDADLNGLLRDVENVLENYLLRGLEDLETPYAIIKAVSLSVTVLVRRQRRLQASSRPVTLEVGGGVQMDIRPTADTDVDQVRSAITSQLDTLLEEDNIYQALRESEIQDAFLDAKDGSSPTATPPGAGATDDTVFPRGTGTDDETDDDDDDSDKPSLLEIIFGFLLVGLGVGGLLIYLYFFCKKRRKKKRKEKQRMESVQYRGPNNPAAVAPTGAASSKSAPPPPQTQPTAAANSYPVPVPRGASSIDDLASDSSSDVSTYKGLNSLSDEAEQEPRDEFGRELRQAASHDKQAWDEFQRRKQVQRIDMTGRVVSSTTPPMEQQFRSTRAVVGSSLPIMYGAHNLQSGGGARSMIDNNDAPPKYARSFPYGDEEDEEQGVEWTPQGMGIDHTRSMPDPRGFSDRSNPDPIISSSLKEIEDLSKFVKRYERQKERRIARERSSHSRSGDYDDFNGDGDILGRSINPTYTGDSVSHLDYSSSMRDEKKFDVHSVDDSAEADYSYRGANSQPQRLGITPYAVQDPRDFRPPDEASLLSDERRADQNRSKRPTHDDAREPQHLNIRSLATLNKKPEKRSPSGLAALRNTSAVVDSSQSDINAPTQPPPQRFAPAGPNGLHNHSLNSAPSTDRSAAFQPPKRKSSGKFNNIRSVFETSEATPMYPPGQNWQTSS